jgi:signal transduction histidine kinase
VQQGQIMKEQHTENFRNVRTGISRNLVAVKLACESLLRGNVADRNGADQVDE